MWEHRTAQTYWAKEIDVHLLFGLYFAECFRYANCHVPSVVNQYVQAAGFSKNRLNSLSHRFSPGHIKVDDL